MTSHPTLFDDELGPFQRHSDTSHDAAVLGYSMTGKDRRRVLLDLHARGDDGATDHEIQVRLDMNPSTERPRRVELVERGLAVDSGARRRTPSGRAAVVWVCTDSGSATARRLLGST